MTLAFIGIPAVGPAVVGWAAVQASHGELNIVLVLIVAALGAEAGGLIGYAIGARWGRRLLSLRQIRKTPVQVNGVPLRSAAGWTACGTLFSYGI